MTRSIARCRLAAEQEIVAAPSRSPRACEDQTFELPGAVYAAFVGLLLAFFAVMAIGFAAPGLAVPMAVIIFFLAAFFGVPAAFIRSTRNGSRALRWSEFVRNGVNTGTGHNSCAEASTLVLTLPMLIFCWGVAVVVIAKLV